MILLLAVVAATVAALLMGGRLGRLPHLGLRSGWLMIVALLVQSYAIYFPASKGSPQYTAASAMLIGSYAMLIIAVWRNGHLAGMKVVGLGLLLNLMVIVVNGGYMPVSPDALVQLGWQKLAPGLEVGTRLAQSKDIVLQPANTRLWFLSDIFVLSGPWPLRSIFSVGDIAIAVGAFMLVQAGTDANLIARLARPHRPYPVQP